VGDEQKCLNHETGNDQRGEGLRKERKPTRKGDSFDLDQTIRESFFPELVTWGYRREEKLALKKTTNAETPGLRAPAHLA